MNILFFQSPCWYSILLPTDLFFHLSSFTLFSFILDFDAGTFLSALMLWHVNDCKWVQPLAVHDTGCHTEQQIKRTVLHILLFSHAPLLSSSLRLPTFLNHPSPVWWAPLSSAPYTNEQSLYASLMVFCISHSGPFTFPLLSPPLISVQNPCMETLQINLCSTVVPVEQQSIGSPSMGTGQRRFIPKTIHVSTNSSALCHFTSAPSHI